MTNENTDRAARSRGHGAAHRIGSGARLGRAWRLITPERRLAAYASIGLFLTMFLPWYQRQFFDVVGGKLQPAADSQTAWGAFSFVEAAILLVAAGVLVLLFQRAEGRAFHLPGGDGWVISAAGVWSSVLIIWRIFDKQGGSARGQNATTYGIEWGIFVALAVAILLAYAGSRVRAAHQPEPPLPGDDQPPARGRSSYWYQETEAAPPKRPRFAPRPPEPERPVGWLTAPRGDRRAPGAPAAPTPKPANPPPAPSTPATRRRPQPDEQLTIPIEPDE